MNQTEQLVARMLSFDGFFDGYPSMTETDIDLICGALSENDINSGGMHCAVQLMSYLASCAVKTKEQYENAKSFVANYVANVWEANMSEGDNAVHYEVCQLDLL